MMEVWVEEATGCGAAPIFLAHGDINRLFLIIIKMINKAILFLIRYFLHR